MSEQSLNDILNQMEKEAVDKISAAIILQAWLDRPENAKLKEKSDIMI